MSAILIGLDDSRTEIGHKPTLKEAQQMVDGLVEVVELGPNGMLLVNEDGKGLRLDINMEATKMAVPGRYICNGDYIAGVAIHLTGKEVWR